MQPTIKVRRDGSIDTTHYIALGRKARSEAAAAMFRRKTPRPARRGGGMGVVLCLTVAALAVLFAMPGLV